uniref:Immunoglobulin C1-set domain-containing protein n=1 Tax=Chelonoidis abingdonii TaxID=106734 RepID=A0A8C0IW48_CHEAB
ITGLNELDGTHRFFMLAKLDGLELASYSSDSREVKPLREWVAQAVGAGPVDVAAIRQYPAPFFLPVSPPGIHTLQLHVNCVLNGDTPVRGQFHFAFDGQDYLILERNQSAWVPLALEASNETHFWDSKLPTARSGGNLWGFYPRPIHISWVRDGAEILPPVNASGILPHANGTYQIRQSLEIPQRWGHSYACRVAHSSLGEPVPTIGKGVSQQPPGAGAQQRCLCVLCPRKAALGAPSVDVLRQGSHHRPPLGDSPGLSQLGSPLLLWGVSESGQAEGASSPRVISPLGQ